MSVILLTVKLYRTMVGTVPSIQFIEGSNFRVIEQIL